MITKKGYLTKQGGNYKNWKRRWFVLKESSGSSVTSSGSNSLSGILGDPVAHQHSPSITLSYYTNEQEKDILGVIDLKHCFAIRKLQQEKEGRRHILSLLSKTRDFLLSADTKQQQEDWFEIIDHCLKTYRIFSDPEPELKTGYLLKQGANRKNWKRRWFVLKNGVVQYYASEMDKKPLGRFNLCDCFAIQLADEDKAKRPYTFELLFPNRIFLISAANESERDEWMEALEDCVPETGTKSLEQEFELEDDGQDDEIDSNPLNSPINSTSTFTFISSVQRVKRMVKRDSLTFDVPIMKQGFLIKQGGVYKNFKKRWFMLQGTSLHYLKDVEDRTPLGTISLEHCSNIAPVEDPKSKRLYCFQIFTPERVYLIQASSNEDRIEWMNAIEDAVPEGNFDNESEENDVEPSPSVVSIEQSKDDKSSIDSGVDERLSVDDPDSEEEDIKLATLLSKNGWLIKEGGQHKSKKRRWFVLDSLFLHYFKSDKDKVPAGTIDLKNCKGIEEVVANNKNAFLLITDERTYFIEGDNETVKSEWVDAINQTLDQIKAFTLQKNSNQEGTPVHRGYLQKRGGSNRGWKKRFFILNGSKFWYYKDEKSSKPLGVIDLGLCRGIRKAPGTKAYRVNTFEIITLHRTYTICAESNLDLENWIERLADGIPDDLTLSNTLNVNPSNNESQANMSITHPSQLTPQHYRAVRIGYMYKLDLDSPPKNGNGGRWHRRWFVLKNNSQILLAYRHHQDKTAILEIDLGKCNSIQEAPSLVFEKKHVFSLQLANARIFILSAPSADDKEEWIDVLGDAVPEDADLPSFQDDVEDDRPLMQGFLTKQGGKTKSWKRRWFVFRGNTISYYKKKTDSEELGVISLRSLTEAGSSIKDELPLEIPNGFAIITPERTYYLGADTAEKRVEWVEVLKNYISSKKGNDK